MVVSSGCSPDFDFDGSTRVRGAARRKLGRTARSLRPGFPPAPPGGSIVARPTSGATDATIRRPTRAIAVGRFTTSHKDERSRHE